MMLVGPGGVAGVARAASSSTADTIQDAEGRMLLFLMCVQVQRHPHLPRQRSPEQLQCSLACS